MTPPSTRPTQRPIIGLAGGIGAGKSAVARILQKLGCVVSDSDTIARSLLECPEIRDTLVSWWGARILDELGGISRSRVASIVFSDPQQRARLEALIHPIVERVRKEQFATAPPDAPAMVIDAPLLFEAGLDRQCDAVIFVDAEPDVRQKRLKAERGWDEGEIRRREDSQIPLDAKRKRADYVVTNNGDWDRLETEVRHVLTEIVGNP